jgi:hypothetical protein
VKVLDPSQYQDAESGAKLAEKELKETLEGLAAHLFGDGIEVGLLFSAGLPASHVVLRAQAPVARLCF